MLSRMAQPKIVKKVLGIDVCFFKKSAYYQVGCLGNPTSDRLLMLKEKTNLQFDLNAPK